MNTYLFILFLTLLVGNIVKGYYVTRIPHSSITTISSVLNDIDTNTNIKKKEEKKYIVVTGGVISGIGKGISYHIISYTIILCYIANTNICYSYTIGCSSSLSIV